MAVKAREFSFAIDLEEGGSVRTEDGTRLDADPAWSPEHLLLAALVRCSLKSLRHHARWAKIDVSDANGSAKVARLAVAQSLAAWKIVEPAGLIDGGLAEYLRGSLERIESELAERFPLAMAFVRPGFDEEIPGIVRPWSIMPDDDDEEDDLE